jgi:hypothetical protein
MRNAYKAFVAKLKGRDQSKYLSVRKNHHHNEHNQGLGLKICSFKAQGVFGLSIFFSVFPYPAVPEIGTGKPASVDGFCPFVPGGLTISFNTVLYLLLCCSLLICYGCQGFSGGPIL